MPVSEPCLPFSEQTRLEARAAEFHAENPEVMERLLDIARQLHTRGIHHAGIKALWERLRWLGWFETTGDRYKLNNSYTAWYARELMARAPELHGMFTTREAGTDPEFHTRRPR